MKRREKEDIEALCDKTYEIIEGQIREKRF